MKAIPTEKELNERYSKYSYSFENKPSKITIDRYNTLLDKFETFRSTGNLLDLGCGRGWFLIEAKKRGWSVWGTEYSDKAIEICKEAGIQTHKEPLDTTQLRKNFFDIITSFEVIEHLGDPKQEIQNVNDLLRVGGLFYCTTPNFNSLMRFILKTKYDYVITYPEHLSYFTKHSLNGLMRRNNFKCVKFQSTGFSLFLIRKSRKKSTAVLSERDYNDEALRERINKNKLLGLIKNIVNSFFTLTNLGMTLKGYYIKK